MPPNDVYVPGSKSLQRHIQVMIRGHELILAILRTPGLAGSLEELKNPVLRRKVAADPLKAARDAEIALPATGVAIYIREFSNNWEVEVQITEKHVLYVFGFNARKGFYVK